MDIKELAKKLCDESRCHHKCKEIDECVVMEEAEELLISQDNSNNFDVKSNNELFKQALVEGVNNHIDKTIEKEKQIEQIDALKDDICIAADYCYGACDECNLGDLAKSLYNAGYRKQSENVIELPCKVGTTLYFLYNSPYADKPDLTPRIYKTDDWQFEVDKTGIVITTSDIHSFNKKYDYYLGEAVFLTQEEAEKALAKMKGGAE